MNHEKNIEILTNQLKSAYRKYKSYIYYDNYSAFQRRDLVDFESENFEDLTCFDEFFRKFSKKISDENECEKLFDDILSKIDVIALPKKLKEQSKDKKIIRNFKKPSSEIERIHYFINMPIEGQILGVLWILRCGYLLDLKLYKNCYGNRLNESLVERMQDNSDFEDFSPFLFHPYYEKYQSWRDEGLKEVENILDKNQNAIMLSLDIKDYYYSCLINFEFLKKNLEELYEKIEEDLFENKEEKFKNKYLEVNRRLTEFIGKVFKVYTKKFNRKNIGDDLKNLPMIPLGFLPSLIIANWNLQEFDKAILEEIHPHYYGRYVDDILIVFNSHEKSKMNGLQIIEEKNTREIIEKYFICNNEFPRNKIFEIKDNKEDKDNNDNKEDKDNNEDKEGNGVEYILKNQKYGSYDCIYKNLKIQDKKLRSYYFNHENSRLLLKNFKKEIYKNSSEFRLMHEMDSIYESMEDKLCNIDYEDSINKLSDIKDINVNKFEISKILSRVNWASSETIEDLDDNLVKQLLEMFYFNTLEFIVLWEKIITTLIINNKYIDLRDFIISTLELINKAEFIENSPDFILKEQNDETLKNSLKEFLVQSLLRVFSLKYNSKIYKIIKEINSSNFEIKLDFNMIEKYQNALMMNNSYMRYPLQDVNYFKDKKDSDENFDLVSRDSRFTNFFTGMAYPRFIKFHEILLHIINQQVFFEEEKEGKDAKEKKFLTFEEIFEDACDKFEKLNFKNPVENEFENPTKNEGDNIDGTDSEDNSNSSNFKNISITEFESNIDKMDLEKIEIKGLNKDKINIGLLNTKLDEINFENRLMGDPNLSSNRFDAIKSLINDSIRNNVELLIMPEMYVPYEWVGNLLKISKDHQIGMIFGVEPICDGCNVKNYIMMLLPFVYNGKYNDCLVVYRLKNHYSPHELDLIKKYGFEYETNKPSKYYLLDWNGISIAPYYCFEIANITARSVFKGHCEIITISEFNKDIQYFNNIAESLSRDLFCYCITSNTSEFGGSSIIQPTSSENKYLINLKGGKNDYLVTHELDIKKLRECAVTTNYHKDIYFKPRPPGFPRNEVKKKMNPDNAS